MYLHKFVLIEAQSHRPVRQRNNIEILCHFILNRSTNKGLILQEYMKMGVDPQSCLQTDSMALLPVQLPDIFKPLPARSWNEGQTILAVIFKSRILQ